jgi:hypothetical protein
MATTNTTRTSSSEREGIDSIRERLASHRHEVDKYREQDRADRDDCLSKMAAAMTMAIEFDLEAAANDESGPDQST